MSQFEIEIKSFLGEKAKAEALVKKMNEFDPNFKTVSKNKQLNHYFKAGEINNLFEKVKGLFTQEEQEKLKDIIKRGKDFSVRTRQKDEEVLLVVKASVDGGTSSNTVSRLEFEEAVKISLVELDNLLLEVGYVYEAKWSRERVEYAYKNANVCIDKNAGYGYLAEFEIISEVETEIEKVRKDLETLMLELGVEELPQDRLARMFAFYNANWSEYYGTEKTFLIE